MRFIKRTFISLIFLYYVWPFSIKILGDYGFFVIYNIIPVAYILRNRYVLFKMIKVGRVLKTFLVLMFLIILLIMFSLSSICINDGEYSYVLELGRIIQRIIVYSFLMIVVIKSSDRKCDWMNTFIKYYVISCCLYVLSTVIFLAFPELRETWTSIIYQSDHQIDMSQELWRQTRYGLKGFTNFGEVTICTIAVAFSNYMIHQDKHIFSRWNIMLYVLLLGCTFYGRSGLILSLMITVLFSVIFMSKLEVKRCFIHFLIIGICIGLIVNLADFDKRFFYLITWVSDPVVSFVESYNYGQISFGSSGDILLENMWFMPDAMTFILGDGYYVNSDGSYYMHTDAGILRHVLFGGMPVLISGYSIILYLCFNILKIERRDRGFKLMIIAIMAVLLIQEIKGIVYFFHIGLLLVLYIFSESSKYNYRQGD